MLERGVNSWILSLVGKSVPLLICGSVMEVKAVVELLTQSLVPDVLHIHYMNLHISGKQWGRPPYNFDSFQLALCCKVGFGTDLVVRPSCPLSLPARSTPPYFVFCPWGSECTGWCRIPECFA